MRIFYFLILLVVIAAIVIFAVENNEEVALKYFTRSVSYPMSLVVGAVYLLGMVSGWTVVSFLQRSFRRATESREDRD